MYNKIIIKLINNWIIYALIACLLCLSLIAKVNKIFFFH